MNAATMMKPIFVELKPRVILSAPRLGPTVRSSMISIGAASAPARSSSEVSWASALLMLPLICTRPPPISSRMTGAVTISPLPFSNRMIAMRLPTFSRVASLNFLAPTLSRLMLTVGSLVRLSNPGCASLIRSPVSITRFFTNSSLPSRSLNMSSPNGGDEPGVA